MKITWTRRKTAVLNLRLVSAWTQVLQQPLNAIQLAP